MLESLLDYEQQEHSDRFEQILKADLSSSKKSKRGYRREQQLTFHVSLRQQGARRVIKATLYSLERLPKVFGKDALTKYQVEAAIGCLEKFDILENLTTRGATERELILKYKDRDEVLRQFKEACKRWEEGKCRNNRDSHVDEPAPTSVPHMPVAPVPSATLTELPNVIALPDWHKICRDRLHAQEQQRLTTNQLTFKDGMAYELDDIPLNLGLVERKKAPKIRDEISPERGLQPSEYEIGKKFKYSEFLAQVLSTQQQGNATKKTRIAITGEPGAGKTTLLQKIAFEVDKNGSLPIVVSLGDLRGRNLRQYLLEDWLVDAVPRRITHDVEDDFVEQFNQGRVWLLLDGVDEMATGSVSALDDLKQQLASSFVARARVVLTCRLNVWDSNLNALETFETYRTLEVSYPEQVGQFIDSWFKKIDPERGQRLKTALAQPEKERIQDLVKNPLRLALLCRTWQREEGDLPDTKAKLYQQFVDDLYWWKWKYEGFRTTDPQRQELKVKLGQLARDAIAQDSSRFRLLESSIYPLLGNRHEEESLFSLACKLGLLIPIGEAAEDTAKWVYAFFHPTFQEYFAACAIDNWNYFLNHIPDNPPPEGYRIFEPRWKEVFLLWLGRDEEKDEEKEKLRNQKEALIKTLVAFEDRWEEFYYYRAYFLAAAGIAEFANCTRADEIVAQIIKWYCGEVNFDKQQSKTLIKLLQEESIATLRQTERGRAVDKLLQLIEPTENYLITCQSLKLLGDIGTSNSKVIKKLEQLIESPENKSTLLHIQLIEILLKIDHNNLKAFTDLFQLIEKIEDETLRKEAINRLGRFGKSNPKSITTLEQIIDESNNNKSILLQAANSLGKIDPKNDKVVPALVQFIEPNEDEINLRQKCENIRSSGLDNYWVSLYLQFNQPIKYERARSQAFERLEKIAHNNSKVIPAIVEVINSTKDESTRMQAIGILGKIGTVEPSTAMKTLVQVIDASTEDESIRRVAADSLVKIDPNHLKAIPELVKLIKSTKDESTLWFATRSLGEIGTGNPEAIAALEALIIESTKDERIRRLAAESLGKIHPDNPRVIETLEQIIKLTEDEDERTHWLAAESLGKIYPDNPKAVRALVKVIKSTENESIRKRTVDSLKKIRRDERLAEIVTALKDYLSDESYKNNRQRYCECYKVIWHCAQNMSYPAFYQAWRD